MKAMRITLERKRALYGYMFTLPFTIGFIAFFLFPLIQSVIFSFKELVVEPGGFTLKNIGIGNYHEALLVNTEYPQKVTVSIIDMVTNVPLVIMFSFFAATLLNQRFKGRTFARAVLFLPVIIATGIIASVDSWNVIQAGLKGANNFKAGQTAVTFLQNFQISAVLVQAGLPVSIVKYVAGAVDRIYFIINTCGVQILIFLAALQSIPHSVYEASNMEGATGWENFWKITFPMVSPLILTNVMYTIIDSFTSSNNGTISIIQSTAFGLMRFGLSAAMAWIYFILVLIILGVIGGLVSKRVFYYDK